MRDAATGSGGFDLKRRARRGRLEIRRGVCERCAEAYVASKPHCLQDLTIVGTDQRAGR